MLLRQVGILRLDSIVPPATRFVHDLLMDRRNEGLLTEPQHARRFRASLDAT
jgi:hypothetical protein